MSLKFLAGEPWAISESGLQLVVAIASRDSFFAEVREKALAALGGKPLENTRAVTMHGDVASIPIDGPLFRKANLITSMSGAVSYETLRQDLEVALRDSKVGSIMLAIDSPGGEAKGVSELAQAIYDARKQKPIKAYVGGGANSAAYWIASAAEEIVALDTAQLGSIGVMAVYPKPEATGEIEFISSQSPYKNASPTTDVGKAKIQARIDAMAKVFVDSVAKYRGVSAATVLDKFGKGDVLVGQNAVKAGLADQLGTFESVLASMISPIAAVGRGAAPKKSTPSISLSAIGRMEVSA